MNYNELSIKYKIQKIFFVNLLWPKYPYFFPRPCLPGWSRYAWSHFFCKLKRGSLLSHYFRMSIDRESLTKMIRRWNCLSLVCDVEKERNAMCPCHALPPFDNQSMTVVPGCLFYPYNNIMRFLLVLLGYFYHLPYSSLTTDPKKEGRNADELSTVGGWFGRQGSPTPFFQLGQL